MNDTVFRTEHLILRPMRIADAEDVHAYAGDPGIDMMLFLPHETPEETKAFAECSEAQRNTYDP